MKSKQELISEISKQVLIKYPDAICKPHIQYGLTGPHSGFAVDLQIPRNPMAPFIGKTEAQAWDTALMWICESPASGEITITEANMIEGYYNARGWQTDNADTVIGIGDTVKLWLKDRWGSESIWVRVTEIHDGYMLGTLSNHPNIMRFVVYGSPLRFRREYIMQHAVNPAACPAM